MRLVYIAGPIRKGCIHHNVGQADDAMLALMRAGYSVINPMLSCWAGMGAIRRDDPTAIPHPHPLAHGGFRDLGAEPWLTMDLEMVKRSDAVLRLPGESSGADGEVSHARECGVPVFFSVDALHAHFAVEGGAA